MNLKLVTVVNFVMSILLQLEKEEKKKSKSKDKKHICRQGQMRTKMGVGSGGVRKWHFGEPAMSRSGPVPACLPGGAVVLPWQVLAGLPEVSGPDR